MVNWNVYQIRVATDVLQELNEQRQHFNASPAQQKPWSWANNKNTTSPRDNKKKRKKINKWVRELVNGNLFELETTKSRNEIKKYTQLASPIQKPTRQLISSHQSLIIYLDDKFWKIKKKKSSGNWPFSLLYCTKVLYSFLFPLLQIPKFLTTSKQGRKKA